MRADDFQNWLEEKGALGACPFCGTNNWIGESDAENEQQLVKVSVVSRGKAHSDDSGRSYSVEMVRHDCYMLTCSHCGFVRLHNVSVVDKND